MRTVQQVNAEYQATMADAADALQSGLDLAADRLHEAMSNAYGRYQRQVSLAHRKYWQASDLARDERDEQLKWAVRVVKLGSSRRREIAGGNSA